MMTKTLGYWLDIGWDYTDEQKAAIREAVQPDGVVQSEEDWQMMLAEIVHEARHYRAANEREIHHQPTKRDVRKQLQVLMDACDRMLVCTDALDAETRCLLDDALPLERSSFELLPNIDDNVLTLRMAAAQVHHRFEARGTPGSPAAVAFARSLKTIWDKHVGGPGFGRWGDKETPSPFIIFGQACMCPIGIRGPDNYLRRAWTASQGKGGLEDG